MIEPVRDYIKQHSLVPFREALPSKGQYESTFAERLDFSALKKISLPNAVFTSSYFTREIIEESLSGHLLPVHNYISDKSLWPCSFVRAGRAGTVSMASAGILPERHHVRILFYSHQKRNLFGGNDVV
jgi:hypothetical protein